MIRLVFILSHMIAIYIGYKIGEYMNLVKMNEQIQRLSIEYENTKKELRDTQKQLNDYKNNTVPIPDDMRRYSIKK